MGATAALIEGPGILWSDREIRCMPRWVAVTSDRHDEPHGNHVQFKARTVEYGHECDGRERGSTLIAHKVGNE
jgi:hypothetical protein